MEPKQNTAEEQKTTYPKPTTDGFCFLDETDEAMEVDTKKYDNGSEVKRAILKDGRVAIIRELKAWETEQSQRFHKNNQDDVLIAMAAMATTIDEKKITFEEIKFFGNKDWIKLKYAVTVANFL